MREDPRVALGHQFGEVGGVEGGREIGVLLAEIGRRHEFSHHLHGVGGAVHRTLGGYALFSLQRLRRPAEEGEGSLEAPVVSLSRRTRGFRVEIQADGDVLSLPFNRRAGVQEVPPPLQRLGRSRRRRLEDQEPAEGQERLKPSPLRGQDAPVEKVAAGVVRFDEEGALQRRPRGLQPVLPGQREGLVEEGQVVVRLLLLGRPVALQGVFGLAQFVEAVARNHVKPAQRLAPV